jgi:hypothetical protein
MATTNSSLARPSPDALRARDPETPLEELEQLILRGHTDDFLMNPVLPVLPVIDGVFLQTLSMTAWQRLISCPWLPGYLLREFAFHPDGRMNPLLGRLLQHPRTPAEHIPAILEGIGAWRLRNQSHPPLQAALTVLLIRRCGSFQELTRLSPGAIRGIFPEVLRSLAGDEDAVVRAYAAAHELTPGELLVKLSRDPQAGVRQAAATNPETPPEVRAELARSQDAPVLAAMARDAETPPELFEALAGASRVFVRALVAEQPRAPREVLEALCSDPSPLVRRALSWNIAAAEFFR